MSPAERGTERKEPQNPLGDGVQAPQFGCMIRRADSHRVRADTSSHIAPHLRLGLSALPVPLHYHPPLPS